jgi:hypothetical protein
LIFQTAVSSSSRLFFVRLGTASMSGMRMLRHLGNSAQSLRFFACDFTPHAMDASGAVTFASCWLQFRELLSFPSPSYLD